MPSDPPDPTYILRGSGGPITSIHFLSTDTLLSGSQNGELTAWCLKTRRPVCNNLAHPGHSILTIVKYAKDEFITQGRDGWVVRWVFEDSTFKKLGSLSYNHMGFCNVSIASLSDQTIIAIPTDNTLSLVNLQSNSHINTLPSPGQSRGMIMKTFISQTSCKSWLFGAYEDGSIIVWDLASKTILCQKLVHSESVMSLGYSSVLNKGLSGSVNDKLCSWMVKEQEHVLETGREVTITNPGVGCVLFRDDGKLVVCGGWDGRARVFGGKKLGALAVLCHHTESVTDLAFSSDNTLAVASKDATISLWDMYK